MHLGPRNISLFAEQKECLPILLLRYSPFHRLSAVVAYPSGNHWMGNCLCKRRSIDKSTQFGCSSISTRVKARTTFITAVRRVIHLIRLRRKSAAINRVVFESSRKLLWAGLDFRHGSLVRIRKVPSVRWQLPKPVSVNTYDARTAYFHGARQEASPYVLSNRGVKGSSKAKKCLLSPKKSLPDRRPQGPRIRSGKGSETSPKSPIPWTDPLIQ